jgi:hypothetical protein
MTTAPGADEIRARRNLIRALDGVRTAPAPASGRDWLDDILDDRPGPADPRSAARLPDWRKGETADLTPPPAPPVPDEPPAEAARGPQEPPADAPEDDTPAPAKARPRPPAAPVVGPAVEHLRHAYGQVPGRARALLYTGSAAAGGWAFGLPQRFELWITQCGHDTGTAGALVLGAGMVLACGVLIDRRTRNWWGPLPWLCRIPLASTLLALALYAPGVTQ